MKAPYQKIKTPAAAQSQLTKIFSWFLSEEHEFVTQFLV